MVLRGVPMRDGQPNPRPDTSEIEAEEGGDARSGSDETDLQAPVLRDPKGLFVSGTRPGPGRFPAGRKASIEVLDKMLAEVGNLERLRTALQAEFNRNPVAFFRQIVMPMIPKTALLHVSGGDGATVAGAILAVRTALGMARDDT